MFHRNLNSEFLSDRAGLRLITFQCYKCPSISSFLWIFTLWGGSGGKKRIYSAAKWRPADGHRQISHHIILFVWNLFILFFNKMYLHIKPSTKSFMFHPVIKVQYVKYSPRVFYRQMMISLPSLCHSTPSIATQTWPTSPPWTNTDQQLQNLTPRKQTPPVWWSNFLSRLKCGLLLTISLATVSFKLSMFLHLCAIIASTYSLLVTLL